MIRISILACLGLTSCQTGPSHVPPPHQIPSAAIGSIIDNSRYNSRRSKVKASIQPHFDFILTEADRGGGPTFDLTCQIARIGAAKCAELARQISNDTHIYKTGDTEEKVEKLTVAFMVYGE